MRRVKSEFVTALIREAITAANFNDSGTEYPITKKCVRYANDRLLIDDG